MDCEEEKQQPDLNQSSDLSQVQTDISSENILRSSSFPKTFIYIGIAALLLAAFCAAFIVFNRKSSNKQRQCNTETRICPDGSSVEMIGPNCEFSQCPTNTVENQTLIPSVSMSPTMTNWNTFQSKIGYFSMQYPSFWKLHLSSDKDSSEWFGDTEAFAQLNENAETNSINVSGRVDFSKKENTKETDIERWFDKTYSVERGMPVTGTEIQKDSVIVTPSNVKVLRTQVHFALDTVQQYFILSNGSIFTITTFFTMSDTGMDSPKNNELKSIYDRMINSITLSTN